MIKRFGHILNLIIALVLATLAASAQTDWTRICPSPTALWLRDLAWFDDSTVIAFDDAEVLFRSTDAGLTWNGGQPWTMAGGDFTRMRVKDSICVIVGLQGSSLVSTDAGMFFVYHGHGTADWNDVGFPTQNRFVYVGNAGKVAVSTNGGNTWSDRMTGTAENLRGVHFADPLFGTLSGDAAQIFRAAAPVASQPRLSMTSTAIGFGWELVGTETIRRMRVTNTGSQPLSIRQPMITGIHAAEYSVMLAGDSLLPTLAFSTFEIIFRPSRDTLRTAVLSFETNDPVSGRVSIPLGGTGTLPILRADPSILDFDTMYAGEKRRMTFTCENVGMGLGCGIPHARTGCGSFQADRSDARLVGQDFRYDRTRRTRFDRSRVFTR